LIDEEISHHKDNGQGFIMAKMNALVDKDIIDALYKASNAGVTIKLVVRGVCCLKPGVPGASEHIEVISIIDRFLEHSRIYFFNAGGAQKVYLASADWMPRNMDRRIEICFPIENPEAKNRLIHEILRITWEDNTKARVLNPDGHYRRRTPESPEKEVRSQSRFIEIAREGGVQSIPYDIAIRHNPTRKQGQRPIAKKKNRRTIDKP
jgi:polyphosphate kinase